MNLPVHIITCQTPSMNLPAHGTTSPDPSTTSLLVKTHTRNQRTTTFLPGSAHTPPGETVPDRLAKQAQIAWRYMPAARRQRSSSAIVFPPPPGGAHPCRQAPHGVGTSDVSLIAWHTLSCCQVLHQWSAYCQFSHTGMSTWTYTTNNTKKLMISYSSPST